MTGERVVAVGLYQREEHAHVEGTHARLLQGRRKKGEMLFAFKMPFSFTNIIYHETRVLKKETRPRNKHIPKKKTEERIYIFLKLRRKIKCCRVADLHRVGTAVLVHVSEVARSHGEEARVDLEVVVVSLHIAVNSAEKGQKKKRRNKNHGSMEEKIK